MTTRFIYENSCVEVRYGPLFGIVYMIFLRYSLRSDTLSGQQREEVEGLLSAEVVLDVIGISVKVWFKTFEVNHLKKLFVECNGFVSSWPHHVSRVDLDDWSPYFAKHFEEGIEKEEITEVLDATIALLDGGERRLIW